MMLIWL